MTQEPHFLAGRCPPRGCHDAPTLCPAWCRPPQQVLCHPQKNAAFWFPSKPSTKQQTQPDLSSQVATETLKRRCPGALKTLWRDPRSVTVLSGDTRTAPRAAGRGGSAPPRWSRGAPGRTGKRVTQLPGNGASLSPAAASPSSHPGRGDMHWATLLLQRVSPSPPRAPWDLAPWGGVSPGELSPALQPALRRSCSPRNPSRSLQHPSTTRALAGSCGTVTKPQPSRLFGAHGPQAASATTPRFCSRSALRHPASRAPSASGRGCARPSPALFPAPSSGENASLRARASGAEVGRCWRARRKDQMLPGPSGCQGRLGDTPSHRPCPSSPCCKAKAGTTSPGPVSRRWLLLPAL